MSAVSKRQPSGFRLTAMTGLRRGEVCGLLWADVDLEGGRLQVKRQITTADHTLVFGERTKSDHGRRTIDIDATTIAIAGTGLPGGASARGWRRLAGSRSPVLLPRGQPLHSESVAKVFERRVARSELRRATFS
jgi:integrase